MSFGVSGYNHPNYNYSSSTGNAGGTNSAGGASSTGAGGSANAGGSASGTSRYPATYSFGSTGGVGSTNANGSAGGAGSTVYNGSTGGASSLPRSTVAYASPSPMEEMDIIMEDAHGHLNGYQGLGSSDDVGSSSNAGSPNGLGSTTMDLFKSPSGLSSGGQLRYKTIRFSGEYGCDICIGSDGRVYSKSKDANGKIVYTPTDKSFMEAYSDAMREHGISVSSGNALPDDTWRYKDGDQFMMDKGNGNAQLHYFSGGRWYPERNISVNFK